MATTAPTASANAFDVNFTSQEAYAGIQLNDAAALGQPAGPRVETPLSEDSIGAVLWPVEANPNVPEVPDVPDDAVIVVEHPDGSADVGIDVTRLPKQPEPRHGRRRSQLGLEILEAEAAASEAMRQQQAQIFRTTVLRKRRVFFMVLLVCDSAFFASSLLYHLLTGGLSRMRRKGLTLKSTSGWQWWLDPRELTLEEMSLSLIVDIVGCAAGVHDKTYLLGLFMILQTIGTVLVSLRGFSLFLLLRVAELTVGAALRSAVFRYLTLLLPEGDAAQLESMFISFWSYITTITGFCGVLCGRDGASPNPSARPPSRTRAANLEGSVGGSATLGARAQPQLQQPQPRADSGVAAAAVPAHMSAAAAAAMAAAAAQTPSPSPQPQPQPNQLVARTDAGTDAGTMPQPLVAGPGPGAGLRGGAVPPLAVTTGHDLEAARVSLVAAAALHGVSPVPVTGIAPGRGEVPVAPTAGTAAAGASGGTGSAVGAAGVSNPPTAVPVSLTAQQLRRLQQQLLLIQYRQRLRQFQMRQQQRQQQPGTLLQAGVPPQPQPQSQSPQIQELQTQIAQLQQQLRRLQQQPQQRGQQQVAAAHTDSGADAQLSTHQEGQLAAANTAWCQSSLTWTQQQQHQWQTQGQASATAALQVRGTGPTRPPQSLWGRSLSQLQSVVRRAVFQRLSSSRLHTPTAGSRRGPVPGGSVSSPGLVRALGLSHPGHLDMDPRGAPPAPQPLPPAASPASSFSRPTSSSAVLPQPLGQQPQPPGHHSSHPHPNTQRNLVEDPEGGREREQHEHQQQSQRQSRQLVLGNSIYPGVVDNPVYSGGIDDVGVPFSSPIAIQGGRSNGPVRTPAAADAAATSAAASRSSHEGHQAQRSPSAVAEAVGDFQQVAGVGSAGRQLRVPVGIASSLPALAASAQGSGAWSSGHGAAEWSTAPAGGSERAAGGPTAAGPPMLQLPPPQQQQGEPDQQRDLQQRLQQLLQRNEALLSRQLLQEQVQRRAEAGDGDAGRSAGSSGGGSGRTGPCPAAMAELRAWQGPLLGPGSSSFSSSVTLASIQVAVMETQRLMEQLRALSSPQWQCSNSPPSHAPGAVAAIAATATKAARAAAATSEDSAAVSEGAAAAARAASSSFNYTPSRRQSLATADRAEAAAAPASAPAASQPRALGPPQQWVASEACVNQVVGSSTGAAQLMMPATAPLAAAAPLDPVIGTSAVGHGAAWAQPWGPEASVVATPAPALAPAPVPAPEAAACAGGAARSSPVAPRLLLASHPIRFSVDAAADEWIAGSDAACVRSGPGQREAADGGGGGDVRMRNGGTEAAVTGTDGGVAGADVRMGPGGAEPLMRQLPRSGPGVPQLAPLQVKHPSPASALVAAPHQSPHPHRHPHPHPQQQPGRTRLTSPLRHQAVAAAGSRQHLSITEARGTHASGEVGSKLGSRGEALGSHCAGLLLTGTGDMLDQLSPGRK